MRALVLEGGGMRGTFTTGVLEAFAAGADAVSGPLEFDVIVACSAGACAAASYLAGQFDRNRRVYLDHLAGNKLIRWSRLLTGGDIMDIDYLTDEVTMRLCPLDLKAVRDARAPLYIGLTDAATGEPRYLVSHRDDLLTALRATCALPFFYRRSVPYQGRVYVDGGVSDPVPVAEAIRRGATELVVVLTSAIEGRTAKRRWDIGRLLPTEPGVRRALAMRHQKFAQAAKLISRPPNGIRVLVVRPSRELPVGRTTRQRARLEQACDQGRRDGLTFLETLTRLEATPAWSQARS